MEKNQKNEDSWDSTPFYYSVNRDNQILFLVIYFRFVNVFDAVFPILRLQNSFLDVDARNLFPENPQNPIQQNRLELQCIINNSILATSHNVCNSFSLTTEVHNFSLLNFSFPNEYSQNFLCCSTNQVIPVLII